MLQVLKPENVNSALHEFCVSPSVLNIINSQVSVDTLVFNVLTNDEIKLLGQGT